MLEGCDVLIPGSPAMARHRTPIGVPPRRGYVFRLRGKRYLVGTDGVRVIRLLEDLLIARATARKPTWMLCFRSRIRGLGGDVRAVLSAALERSGDPSGRLLVKPSWRDNRNGWRMCTR